MPWVGRSVGVIVALVGLAAALGISTPGHAQELPVPTTSVPALPVPTVSVPTVSVPTVPSPPPPLPAPPPSEPIPTPSLPPAGTASTTVTATSVISSPTTSRTAATAPTSAPASSAAEPAPPSGPFAWSTGSSTESRPAATERRERRDRLEAKPQRSKGRVSVRLEFLLPNAKRVFIIVRGPAPSCRIAGVIPFRGRKGENAAQFSGRIRGRVLDPGVYLLTISQTRRLKARAPTEYVRVASPRRTVPLPDRAKKPTCTVARSLAADPIARFLNREPASPPALPSARANGPTAPLRPPLVSSPPAATPDDADGGFGPIPSAGEIGTAARESVGEAVAAIVIVALVGLLLLAMLGLVTRFMRGSWNP